MRDKILFIRLYMLAVRSCNTDKTLCYYVIGTKYDSTINTYSWFYHYIYYKDVMIIVRLGQLRFETETSIRKRLSPKLSMIIAQLGQLGIKSGIRKGLSPELLIGICGNGMEIKDISDFLNYLNPLLQTRGETVLYCYEVKVNICSCG